MTKFEKINIDDSIFCLFHVLRGLLIEKYDPVLAAEWPSLLEENRNFHKYLMEENERAKIFTRTAIMEEWRKMLEQMYAQTKDLNQNQYLGAMDFFIEKSKEMGVQLSDSNIQQIIEKKANIDWEGPKTISNEITAIVFGESGRTFYRKRNELLKRKINFEKMRAEKFPGYDLTKRFLMDYLIVGNEDLVEKVLEQLATQKDGVL